MVIVCLAHPNLLEKGLRNVIWVGGVENSVVASTEAPHRAVRVAPVFWGATVSGQRRYWGCFELGMAHT